MSEHLHDWWGSATAADSRTGPARPSRRHLLLAAGALPWLAAVVLLVGRGGPTTATAPAAPAPSTPAPARPVAEAASGVAERGTDGPAVQSSMADLTATERALVFAAVRDLAEGTPAVVWVEDLTVVGVQRRAGWHLVGVVATALSGPALEDVGLRQATVALFPDGSVVAWWRANQAPAGPASSPVEAPEVIADVTAALTEAGYGEVEVVALGQVGRDGPLLADIQGVAPGFTVRGRHRVLLDPDDLEVMNDPWGEP